MTTSFRVLILEGTSFVDHHYTKAYLRHLFQAKEMLGAQIGSMHNLAFYTGWLAKPANVSSEALSKHEGTDGQTTSSQAVIFNNLLTGEHERETDKTNRQVYYQEILGTFFLAITLIISISIIFDISSYRRFYHQKGTCQSNSVRLLLNFIPYFANLFASLFTFIAVIFFTSKMAL